MAIAFEELEGSPRVQISSQGTTATRVFRVAWADWQSFARLLVGTYRLIGLTPQFIAPIQFPGFPNLIVTDVQVEPFDARAPDGNVPITLGALTNRYSAGGAKVTAVYRTLFDGQSDGRSDLPQVPRGTYLTFTADLSAEYVTSPGRTWYWNVAGADLLAEDMQPGRWLPAGSFQLAWQRVPLPPWEAIRRTRGKVNRATFLSSPPGTVLFQGARVAREFQFLPSGGLWRLEYHFAESLKTLSDGVTQVGWNYFFRPKPAAGEQWVELHDERGNPPYEDADFDALFQFGAP